ncbi:WD40 repeat-like protein [Mycena sanguinolenta]|uniref:WD40 repeat-like protein n=1 Tax=Mycena sanguinolenta TaxID=230812 RepID=A0A8H6YJR1_9AGAR|nr:WD40 repeat-like protein [Mycena sanguinolenta]
MYDGSSITDTESMTGVSVASILGIKGGLRIRRHTINQKAHVVLRRAEPSDDSSDDGQENDIVVFRLFAVKPINVKPGKELLLTIASEDDRFKGQGQNVVFEGTLRGAEEDSDHEGTTQVEEEPQVIEEEEEEIIPESVMPPKMRRQWTKRVEEVRPVVFKIPVAHSSVGVQAQPTLYFILGSGDCLAELHLRSCAAIPRRRISSDILFLCFQCRPDRSPPPIPSYASMDVQTNPICASSTVQTDPPPPVPSYARMDVQVDPMLPPVALASVPQTVNRDLEVKVASLSTLAELTINTYSIPLQSISTKSPFTSIPSISVEIPSSHDLTEDMEISPTDTIFPSADLVEDAHPPPPCPCSVTDMFDLDHSPDSRALPRNIFVSGGFLVDFLGAVPLAVKEATLMEKSDESPTINSIFPNPSTIDSPFAPSDSETSTSSGSHGGRAPKRAKLIEIPDALFAAAVPSFVNDNRAAQSIIAADARETGGDRRMSPNNQVSSTVAPRRVRPPVQNAVASSSKTQLMDSPLTTPSILPRVVILNRVKEKAPVAAEKQQHDVPSPSSSPPPDPKALARIPAGPSSNPLGIRPSHSSSLSMPARPTTSSHGAPAGKGKKPLVVGRGWPFVRAVKPASVASTASADSKASEPNLNTIVGYTSRSPSPSVESPVSPVSKRERVDSALSVDVQQNVDYLVDMVMSEPISGSSSLSHGASTSDSHLHRISSEIHDQITTLKEARTETASLLSRISTTTREESSLEQRPSQSPVASPVASSSLLARISPDVSQANAASAQPSSSHQTPATLSQVNPGQSATVSPPQQRERLSPVITPVSPALSQRISLRRQNFHPPKKSTLPLPLPMQHPLPAKPPNPNNPLSSNISCNAPRGIKRECPSPDIVRMQPKRRTQHRRWRTVEWTDSDVLMGDGDVEWDCHAGADDVSVRRIVFNSDGSCFALSCQDKTVRIWSNKRRLEIARLSHNSQVVGLAWMENKELMSLDEDGVVSKWITVGEQSKWQCVRVLTVDPEDRAPGDTVCLACTGDRIAIAFPKTGVKVWIWTKGSWRAQRSIMRKNVTALKFIEGGDALLGGTREGVVWHCAVPNGTMKVYAFLQSSITSISIDPTGMQGLVTQASGSACMVKLGLHDEKRVVGAVFSTQGKTVVFGTVDGCLLTWDALKGAVLYGMEQPEGDLIQAVASCDGPRGCVVAGTLHGRLLWLEPEAPAQSSSNSGRKRLKVD